MQNTADRQEISIHQGVIPDLFKLEQLKQLKAKKCLGGRGESTTKQTCY